MPVPRSLAAVALLVGLARGVPAAGQVMPGGAVELAPAPDWLAALAATGSRQQVAPPYALPVATSSRNGGPAASPSVPVSGGTLRTALVALAMKLRDVRYVRGGRTPGTGFDCSGFVRYVFARAAGVVLPHTSAGQFRAGRKIGRGELLPGDLVFFHTRGRHVSHVGIYLADGRFIHSPSPGKSVEISSLAQAYWARRFIGARRPRIARSG